MKKTVIAAFSVSLLLGIGCGDDGNDEILLENATFLSALSEGDGEAIDGSEGGDVEMAAEEDVDEAVAGELEMHRDCSMRAVRERVRAHYDENGNGKLDDAEREQLRSDFGERPRHRYRWARQHRWQRLRWVYDADDSGDLSDGERQELRNDVEERCLNRTQWLIDTYDADGDGMLDDSEWEAARLAVQARVQERRQEMLRLYDSNGNGEIDEAERRAAVQARRQECEQRREQLRLQFDANGDGVLDEGERAQAREELKKRIRGEEIGAFTP